MVQRLPVEAAETVFRDLGGLPVSGPRIPEPAQVLTAVERFATVEFDVSPELPDQDGFLFEYTTIAGDTIFSLGITRQFEIVDADGDHERFVQLHCGYRLPVDPELTAEGHQADWWFRGGPEPFEAWFARVADHPIWRHLQRKVRSGFEIRQETV